MKTMSIYKPIIVCIPLAVLLTACHSDKENNCTTYRLRYITDIRYDGGQGFVNRFSVGYEDDGKLITRYYIPNTDTIPSDYVKLNSNGQPIEYGFVPDVTAPTIRHDYVYQSDRVVEKKHWNSISPGAPIMLAQTAIFTYSNGLLGKITYFAPNVPAPISQVEVFYQPNSHTKDFLYVELPSQQLIQDVRYHFTNLVNPLAMLEIGEAWGTHEFLADTTYTRLSDGTYQPGQIYEHETLDNRVVRTKTYYGDPVELKRDVTYEYECY